MDFDYTTETITPDTTNILTVGGSGGLELPVGTTAQRPGSPSNGLIRYNTDTGQLEGYFSNTWANSVSSMAYQVLVQKTPGPGEFGSIADAIASISGATATTPWTVIISSGTYTEPEITIPSYIQVTGIDEGSVYVQPLTNTQNLFVMSTNTSISFLSMQDVGAGYAAIKAHDVGDYALCHKVSINNCDIGWDISASTTDSMIYLEYCDTTGGTTGVSVASSSGKSMYANFENFYVYGVTSGGNPTDGLHVTGSGSIVNIQAFGFEGVDTAPDGADDAIHVQDGAMVVAKAGHIFGWDNGAAMYNTGAASNLQFLAVEINNNTTWDLYSEHPDATGTLNGTARKAYVNVVASPNFTLAFADTLSNDYIQTGAFFLGQTVSSLTDVTDLIIKTAPLGILSGGALSIVSGLTVNISAGTGYLTDLSGVVSKISWPSTNITLSASAASYIYVDGTGTISQALSIPSSRTHIILVKVLCGPTTVITSGPDSFNINHYGNGIDEFFKSTMGPVYVSGSIVSENMTTPRALDVTSGNWYYSIENILPAAGTGITFLDVYQVSGTTTFAPLTQVDNTTYLTSGNLTALTSSWYAKHTLYSSGEDDTQTYFMQHAESQYATLQEAIDAPLAAPLMNPEGIPHIAAIIVQEGATNIVQIIDIRPKFFGSSGTGVFGVSDHGELTGLLDDDHPQYLLVNGTRAMSGSLDLGTNTIVNSGTINGIAIESHGTRHGANGADPVPTAAPITSLTSSSTNAAGIANTLARSDHSHQVSGFQPLSTNLTNLSAVTSTGLLISTSATTWATRTLTGTSGRISIADGDGISSNPVVDISSSYIGQSSITTTGTITTGIWNSSTIQPSYGGTGLSSLGSANQVLGMNSSASVLEYKTVSAGTAIGISNTAGTITINNNGVTSNVAGTGIGVSGSTGAVTISNTGVTSIIAGTGIGVSGSTGAVTISSTVAGTVTSVGVSGGTTGLTSSGSPVTTSGTITLAGTLIAANGGTGQNSYSVGDILYASTTSALSRLADVATGSVLISGGIGVAPGWGKVNLTTHVSGILPVASGGTNLSSVPTNGQLLIGNGTNYTLSTLTAGSGITITNGTGTISIATSNVGTVTSIAGSGGTTGMTLSGGPITTSGTLTLGGTLVTTNGGTGLSSLGTANQLLGVNGSSSGLEYKTVTAGTGISITNSAGSLTVNNTGVTSVALSLPSIFSISGSPVTTSGTLTGTLATQSNNTIFAGPASSGPLAPTFRSISLAQNDLSDVVITTPSANQVLAYNSGTSKWVNTGAVGANATGAVGVSPAGGGTSWTLVSGTRYTANFVHNLGTQNVVITVYDTNDNSVVIPQSTVATDANTVTIVVTGNTKTLRVVVVANGQSIVAGGSTPSSVITALSGVTISTAATKLNFTGQAVNVVDAGAGTTNIAIGSRFTFFAASLDSPNNADYAVNAMASAVTDPTYTSLTVRSFSNTTEQGVGCLVSIPVGATTLTIKMRGRSQTAQGSAEVVQPRLYYRLLPNNSAVGAWSSAQELANIAIPTNANFQYGVQTINLSTLGLIAGDLYQFEITRRVSGVTGTNLATNYLMAELTLEFA